MAEFWKHLYRAGRLPVVVLYLALALVLTALLSFTIQGPVDRVLGPYTFPVFIFPLIVLAMFVLYGPTLARQYRVQFDGKFRPGIPEDELRGLLTELSARALELVALIVAVACALCIGLYWAAEYLSLRESTTVMLMAVIVLNTFLVSLLISTFGRYNRAFLRKTFDEGEYRRYTSPGNYKVIIALLAVVDLLAIIYLAVVR
jgi:hypothetical protein